MKNNGKKTNGVRSTSFKRRLVIILTVAAVLTAYLYYGNTAVTVTRYDISSEKIPPDFDGFRIVQISDLHNSGNSVMKESLISKTANAKPDVILLTGDMVDSYFTDVSAAISMIEKLNEIAPMYYVIGNHEARTGESSNLIRRMRELGIGILWNSYSIIRVGNDEIVIAGINDPRLLNKDGTADDAAIARESLGSLDYDREMYTILLSHRPELLNTYATYGIDLVFAGHAHGGLVRLPFIGGLYAPHQGLLPDYTGGVIYQIADTSMIVSRGVGNSGDTFRINDNPELVVTVLHAGC